MSFETLHYCDKQITTPRRSRASPLFRQSVSTTMASNTHTRKCTHARTHKHRHSKFTLIAFLFLSKYASMFHGDRFLFHFIFISLKTHNRLSPLSTKRCWLPASSARFSTFEVYCERFHLCRALSTLTLATPRRLNL